MQALLTLWPHVRAKTGKLTLILSVRWQYLHEDDRVPDDDQERLGARDGHVEALGVAPEAHMLVCRPLALRRGLRRQRLRLGQHLQPWHPGCQRCRRCQSSIHKLGAELNDLPLMVDPALQGNASQAIYPAKKRDQHMTLQPKRLSFGDLCNRMFSDPGTPGRSS